MKKFLITLTLAIAGATQLFAMSDREIRENARFLSDRMAYELNLTPEQYEDCYEINYDFIASIDPVLDDVAYGYQDAIDRYYDYLDWRNEDLRMVMAAAQFTRFCALEYFVRPIYTLSRRWRFRVYDIYSNWNHFYFGLPHIYHTYHGAHSRLHHVHGFYGGRYHHTVAHHYDHFVGSHRYHDIHRHDFGSHRYERGHVRHDAPHSYRHNDRHHDARPQSHHDARPQHHESHHDARPQHHESRPQSHQESRPQHQESRQQGGSHSTRPQGSNETRRHESRQQHESRPQRESATRGGNNGRENRGGNSNRESRGDNSGPSSHHRR